MDIIIKTGGSAHGRKKTAPPLIVASDSRSNAH
jgi:hypothetical protein